MKIEYSKNMVNYDDLISGCCYYINDCKDPMLILESNKYTFILDVNRDEDEHDCNVIFSVNLRSNCIIPIFERDVIKLEKIETEIKVL